MIKGWRLIPEWVMIARYRAMDNAQAKMMQRQRAMEGRFNEMIAGGATPACAMETVNREFGEVGAASVYGSRATVPAWVAELAKEDIH